MVTFNFTLRSMFFTGANRIIFFSIRPKNIGGWGYSPASPLFRHPWKRTVHVHDIIVYIYNNVTTMCIFIGCWPWSILKDTHTHGVKSTADLFLSMVNHEKLRLIHVYDYRVHPLSMEMMTTEKNRKKIIYIHVHCLNR